MFEDIKSIVLRNSFSREEIIRLLSCKNENERKFIFEKAVAAKNKFAGNSIYLRGLIEYSNRCRKNCLYCGLRSGNEKVKRYQLNDQEVLNCAEFALNNNYSSLVIQSGERCDRDFILKIDSLLQKIKVLSNGKLRITLSCGEQTKDTYLRWFESGAHRYLLRIETSNPDLYRKIHPDDAVHSFDKRLKSLENLKIIGYQVGSGMMIGFPFQTVADLADDLLFLKKIDIDMTGLGPYVENPDTPMSKFENLLLPKEERLNLSLLTIAVLRLMMKDINIAASTALDALNPSGRLMAFDAGANVLMPNITPIDYRTNYWLYENKPFIKEAAELTAQLKNHYPEAGKTLITTEWGDSNHFFCRMMSRIVQ